MSARAVYTFIDRYASHHVYKHHDGYPSGAAEFIRRTFNPMFKGAAWKLPRFEADEAAASFVAVNKDGSGGVRLTHSFEEHGDLEYRYEISPDAEGEMRVKAFSIFNGTPEVIYDGPLFEMQKWALEYEEG